MILYIKRGCPWCIEAEQWLRGHGVAYTAMNVLADREAFSRMKAISGQTKAPVLVTEDNRVLADFGIDQLPKFLGSR
jgi:glutaredoxin